MDSGSGGSYGIPQKRLHGHDISSQMLFFLQMDTLHCLDLGTKPYVCGICQQATQFDDKSHTKDVMSVAFSA